MTIEAAEKISSIIGDVAWPIEPKYADGETFLRVKVAIDLSLPLCRGRLISLENKKQIWATVRHSESEGNALQKGKEGDESIGLEHCTTKSNGRNSINSNKDTLPADQNKFNYEINRDFTQSMGSDMQHKGFDAQIKETNDELSKFDSSGPSHLIFFGPESRASPTPPILAQFSESREETARVSPPAK
uniref:Uncharacterized protein n=1 Tax=Quercus lobata TaxID=97700 RepID=A0A7N2MJI1_QUELO